MRCLAAVFLSTALFASSAFAGPVEAPLSAGKPAGVKHAQAEGNTVLLVAGIAVVAGGIALVASGNGSGPAVTTSATGSGTP